MNQLQVFLNAGRNGGTLFLIIGINFKSKMDETMQFVWFIILFIPLILLSHQFETDIYNEVNMVGILVYTIYL